MFKATKSLSSERQILKDEISDKDFRFLLNEKVGPTLANTFCLKPLIAIPMLWRGGANERKHEINIALRTDLDRLSQCDEYVYWILESSAKSLDMLGYQKLAVMAYCKLYELMEVVHHSPIPSHLLLLNVGESWLDEKSPYNILLRAKYYAAKSLLVCKNQDVLLDSFDILPNVSKEDVMALFDEWNSIGK